MTMDPLSQTLIEIVKGLADNSKLNYCFPSRKYLQKEAGERMGRTYSLSTIDRRLKKLDKMGYVPRRIRSRDRGNGSRERTSSLYFVTKKLVAYLIKRTARLVKLVGRKAGFIKPKGKGRGRPMGWARKEEEKARAVWFALLKKPNKRQNDLYYLEDHVPKGVKYEPAV